MILIGLLQIEISSIATREILMKKRKAWSLLDNRLICANIYSKWWLRQEILYDVRITISDDTFTVTILFLLTLKSHVFLSALHPQLFLMQNII